MAKDRGTNGVLEREALIGATLRVLSRLPVELLPGYEGNLDDELGEVEVSRRGVVRQADVCRSETHANACLGRITAKLMAMSNETIATMLGTAEEELHDYRAEAVELAHLTPAQSKQLPAALVTCKCA